MVSSGAEACSIESGQDRTPEVPPPVAGRWREAPLLPEPRMEVNAATLASRVFLVGSQELTPDETVVSSATIYSFDPSDGSYERVPDAPVPIDHTVAATHDSHLYVAGGVSNGEPTNGAWRYSPDKEVWREIAPMRVARYSPAGAVIGDKLYIAGGAVSEMGAPLSSMEVYDFETGSWRAGPDMPTARHHAAAAALDGDLYVAGGRQPGDFSLDSFERFDPGSGEWEELPAIPYGTGGTAAVATENEVVVTGGGDDEESWVTGAVWAFDPKREAWRRLPNMNLPRHGHAAAMAEGRIYVFGGAPCPLFGQTERVESLRRR